MNVGDYLTEQEVQFYERGIPTFAGRTGVTVPGMKLDLYNNPVLFFKRATRYMVRNLKNTTGNTYPFQKIIDDSNLARGRKRKLKRVLLDDQDEEVKNSLMMLVKEDGFQKLYSRTFLPEK